MKALCLLLLLSTGPLAAGDSAAQPSPEALVGEDRGVPTAVPTPEADAGGPRMVTRTQQAAPSFALPAFVVQSGGERQDLVQRGDLGTGLDTSGGIKTSPGEAGAGQQQRATEAVRATPQDETYTPTQRYGELTASTGLGNTWNLDGLLAAEEGPWYGWLDGGTHFTDGGHSPAGALEPAQRHDGNLAGQGGWRMDPDNLFEASVDGAWRSLRLTSVPGDRWQQRYRTNASLGWEGDWLGLTQRVQVHGGDAEANLPGYAYGEDGGGLDVNVEKSLNGRFGASLLDGGLNLGELDQRTNSVGRNLWLGRVWLEVRLEPWAGSRLGLGLQADGDGGTHSAFQWGPRIDFEQRLARDLGLRLELGNRLILSRLAGDAFDQDPLLPNSALVPMRRIFDFKAGLPMQILQGLSLEPGAFVREDVDAFLPGVAPSGLWTDTEAGTLFLDGLSLNERYERGAWWQSLEAFAQGTRLSGSRGLVPTFIAPWKTTAAIGFKRGAWSAQTG